MGESIENIAGTYSASDIEDGNLTESVSVKGLENVNLNKAGKYKITYSVTDSNMNTVEKTRTISVIDMNEFTYLTDVAYKSASQSWSKLAINKAVSGMH